MSIEALLVIVGGFATLGISINAFFLKGIYSQINDVNVRMSGLISNAEHTNHEIERIEKSNSEEILRMREKIHNINNILQKQSLEIERLKR